MDEKKGYETYGVNFVPTGKSMVLALIVFAICLGTMIIVNMSVGSVDNNMNSVLSDLNVLKSNDLAFAQYITANSQTLEYLNKNCKVTSDTNEVTVLTCIKVKQ